MTWRWSLSLPTRTGLCCKSRRRCWPAQPELTPLRNPCFGLSFFALIRYFPGIPCYSSLPLPPYLPSAPPHTPSYRIGEAFFHLAPATAMRRLKTDRRALDAELMRLEARVGECEAEMRELKVVL